MAGDGRILEIRGGRRFSKQRFYNENPALLGSFGAGFVLKGVMKVGTVPAYQQEESIACKKRAWEQENTHGCERTGF